MNDPISEWQKIITNTKHLFMRMRYEILCILFLECPRSKDRMERFACPTPDFRSRYVSTMKIHKHNRNYYMKFLCRILIMKFILIGIDALMIDLYAMVFLIVRGRKTKIQSNAYSIRRWEIPLISNQKFYQI